MGENRKFNSSFKIHMIFRNNNCTVRIVESQWLNASLKQLVLIGVLKEFSESANRMSSNNEFHSTCPAHFWKVTVILKLKLN